VKGSVVKGLTCAKSEPPTSPIPPFGSDLATFFIPFKHLRHRHWSALELTPTSCIRNAFGDDGDAAATKGGRGEGEKRGDEAKRVAGEAAALLIPISVCLCVCVSYPHYSLS